MVLLVHGIRDQGEWQAMVRRKLEVPGQVKVIPIKFGFLHAVRFWLPFGTRERPIERVYTEMRVALKEYKDGPDLKLSVIAHSFGTYVVGEILRRGFELHLHRLVLCGAVLPQDFPWHQYRDRFGRVVNECGKADIWPVLAQSLSWGYGASGTHGFGAVLVEDRYHAGGHGQYLRQEFVEQFWEPFIKEGRYVESDFETKMPKTPWWVSVLGILPLKWLLAVFVVAAIIGSIYLALEILPKPPTPDIILPKPPTPDIERKDDPPTTQKSAPLARSRFITPDPHIEETQVGVSASDMPVLTQGGVLRYRDVRNRGLAAFIGLISNARIELDQPEFAPSLESDVQSSLSPSIIPLDVPDAQSRRNQALRVYVNQLFLNNLNRDGPENLAILVPPGGLPPGLFQSLAVMREKLTGNPNVRLDIVIVGPQSIDLRLRDLAIRSRGSVLTVADIDEVATIAQRLRDEQTSGAWVIIPHQGTIPSGAKPVSAGQFEERLAWAKTLAQEVMQVLQGTEYRLRMLASLHAETRTESAQQQIDRARQILSSLLNCVTRLHAMNWDSPSESAGQLPPFRQARGMQCQTLMALIRDGRDAVNAARQLVTSATRPEVEADYQTKDLYELARYLEDKSALGPGLVKVDKMLCGYEKVLEAAVLEAQVSVPIYQRVDRAGMERLRVQIDRQAIGKYPNGIDSIAETSNGGPTRLIRLTRFYVESDANSELALGLSRPLPQFTNVSDFHEPTLEFYDDFGVRSDSDAKLILSQDASSRTLLVWRADAPDRLAPGWYTPFLRIDSRAYAELDGTASLSADDKAQKEPEATRRLAANEINYTFSVGSDRKSVQLITHVVEDPDDADLGTLHPGERAAVIEVQVSAGSPVLGAKIEGFYQRITKGAKAIEMRRVVFEDKGQVVRAPIGDQAEVRDRTAGDGTYTGSVVISDVQEPTEFRVFVQADTASGSQFIPLDNPDHELAAPARINDSAERARRSAEGPAPRFQRATVLQFVVES